MQKQFLTAVRKNFVHIFARKNTVDRDYRTFARKGIKAHFGYIKGFKVEDDGKQGVIEIALKYGPNKSQVITGLRRVSKPGLRIYTNCEDMPRVMKGLGIAILSTSKGIMTDKDARKANVGGEVLAFIW